MTTLTTPPTRLRAHLDTPRAALAVTLMFAVNGSVVGGYAGVLPSLRERLGVDATGIAIMLFAAGLAAITSMQIGGRLSDALSARLVALVSLPLLMVSAIVLALAPTFPVAVIGVVVMGLGHGGMDVSMNALGVQVEQARTRAGRGAIMSFFHAFWSVGNFVGAGLVLALATVLAVRGAAIVAPVMISVGVLALAGWVILLWIAPTGTRVTHSVGGKRTAIPRAAWLLGLMALAFGLSEGTANDWSAIHVTDVARVDSTTGSLGLVAVTAFMVVIRLIGDRLVNRFGRRAVVRFGGVCAAVGYLGVSVVDQLPLLLVGWALVGFGVGMIAPQVYSTAGHIGGGRVLAVVVTFGYASFLAGPGVIGFAVRHLGIQHTMGLPAVLCAGIIAMAAVMPRGEVTDGSESSRRQES